MPSLAGSAEQGRPEFNDFSIPFIFQRKGLGVPALPSLPRPTQSVLLRKHGFSDCVCPGPVSFLTFWAFWHAAVTAASTTLRKHHGLRATCFAGEKRGWQVAVPCSSGKGGGWGEICLLSASWEAVERVAEGIRLCKQLVWMGEEELMRARKAKKGTSWVDHAGQKKHPSPRKSFLPPVHSDTRPSILSHFLSFLSLEKLAISPSTKAFGQPLSSWSACACWTSQKATCSPGGFKPLHGVERRLPKGHHVVQSLLPFCALQPTLKRPLKRGEHNRHYPLSFLLLP